ncbi:B12-binding domain-containing radical SAM protein [Mesorhizobium sp. CA14]|uniref:B12-binding domain-containing radical SAM protein n=1 Tax=Mesorhizobium sp. CA14 TaxID=2876642 RepID=UPI001CCFF4EE|nr:radical SAM protein [Mesorhizobium sp. CA14]MBZ9849678.1 B12-binding domain-containing radical SAM protein [Mesorhizobium sp. CA14]
MRVAIVFPEVLDMARYRERRKEFPPFGALYIAASLEQAGHDVKIVKINPFELVHDFRGFDAVGFSISASATFNLFLECRKVSTFEPDTLLMAGGVHVNLFPEQTLIDLRPDVICVGEGEDVICEILEHAGDRDFSSVPGVAFLDGERYVRVPGRRLEKNIDRFPLPARHLLNVDDFVMSNRMSNTDVRMTHIMPGRGCPFPCRYCASAQTRVQYRSGDDVRHELEHLVDRYGIEGFAVVGNDFILSKTNVFDICNRIADLDLSWATLSRVDRVDPDVLAAMRRAGCHELEFGVESGSQRILDAMDKRATVDQVRYALRASHEAGIKNKVFLVHGFPGEDMASTEETIRLLDEVAPYIERTSLFRFVPLPGTYVYNNAVSYGIRGTDADPSWDGDWAKYHIHHNHHHWWGTDRQFAELTDAFWRLWAFVEERWPSKIRLEDLPADQWLQQSRSFAKSGWRRQNAALETVSI